MTKEENPQLLKLGSSSQILKDIAKIFNFLSLRRKVQLALLMCLQVLAGIAEIISLGALLPFLSALSNADAFMNRPELKPVIRFLDIQSESELIIYTTVAFVGAFVFVNMFKLFTFWAQNRMSVVLGGDLSVRFFRQILSQDFEYHLNTNSGVVISRLAKDLSSILHFISSAMMISTQGFTIFSIVSAVLYYDPYAAVIIFSVTLFLYVIIASINKKNLVKSGRVVSDSYSHAIQNLQIALGGIRDVLLGNMHSEFLGRYARADRSFRKAYAKIQMLSILPRYFLEIAGVGILAVMAAYYALAEGGVFGALPLMGGLAMATVRILPAAQMAYNSYASMQSAHVSVDRVLEILDLPVVDHANGIHSDLPVPQHDIKLEDVWFRFRGQDGSDGRSDWILKGIDLQIPARKTVALVGKTGGGKTTISDVVSGLLFPERGRMLIDGVQISPTNIGAWRRHVACVPQSIFLVDASIKENVAFGEKPELVDEEKVKKVCALAQIDQLIEERPRQYDEIIGENGLRLSGGQRQRIGIARALYKDASVILLDEATSALDNQTEKAVMETIAGLHGDRTVLIIAHRLETIKKADLIYEIEDGKVVASGTYQELIERSSSFRDIAYAGEEEKI